ncbi:hypothetical protein ACQY0O_000679 [Thecaphora frezii]
MASQTQTQPQAAEVAKALLEPIDTAIAASSPAAEHSFDRATRCVPIASPPEALVPVLDQLAPGTKFYQGYVDPAYGSTRNMPNGGYIASTILAAALEHQRITGAKHPDPHTITFDYLKACRPAQEVYVAIHTAPRGSGGYTTLTASMYQIGKSKEADGPGKAVQTVTAWAMFCDQTKQKGMTTLPQHYGEVGKVEDVPVPHPRSWFLPPDQAMISQQLDLLVQLETQRRPYADYFIRFHPTTVGAQQDEYSDDETPPSSPGGPSRKCKGSKKLPLYSAHARRVDTLALPTIADFRRPAMENVLKKDASSHYDEPTRTYAYPTVQFTLRFLGEVPKETEWVHSSWRETLINGRIISDIVIRAEDGTPLAIGQMDSLMFDMRWYKM